MAGAYAAYVTQQVISSTGLSIVVAIPVAFVVAGLLGLLLEMSIIQWMYKRPLDTLLVTVGVSLVLQQLAKDVFGAQGDPVTRAELARRPHLGVRLRLAAPPALHDRAGGRLRSAALNAVLKYSSFGRQIRATVQNRELAETMGVSTRNVDRITFFLGSGLAGVGGVAIALISGTNPTLGTTLHHPGVPRGRRRRRRAAQGHGDRRVGGRRGHGLPHRLDQRQHGAGHHLRPRGGLPHRSARRASSPSGRGRWHDDRHRARGRRSAGRRRSRGRHAEPVLAEPAARHLRRADRHRRPRAGAAGVGAQLADRVPPRQPRQVLRLGARRRSASASPGVAAACSSWARACSSGSAATRWPCT